MGRRRLSDDYIQLALMDHLVRRKESGEGPCTAHYLTTIDSIPMTQRQQRIERILSQLCEWEYVRRFKSTAGTLYEVTEDGYQWFKERGRKFLEHVRRSYK